MFLFKSQVHERVDLNYARLNELLILKKFPLPVKDHRGTIVWIESEVDEWLQRNDNRR